MLIARRWTGRIRSFDVSEYEDYLRVTGLAQYRRIAGNRGAVLLRRELGPETQVETLSFWDDYEAIKAFAGEQYEVARYYPEDDRFLLDKPNTVDHFMVPFCNVDRMKFG